MASPAIRIPTPTWNGGSSATGTIAFAANNAGNTILAFAQLGSATTGNPVDTKGNVYLPVQSQINSLFSPQNMSLWWCQSCAASASTNTLSVSGTGTQDVVFHAMEYAASTISVSGKGENNGTAGVPSLTLAGVGATDTFVMFGYVFSGNCGVGTIGGAAANDLGSALSDMRAQDRLLTSGGSVTSAMTGSSSWGNWVGVALTPAGAAAGDSDIETPMRKMQRGLYPHLYMAPEQRVRVYSIGAARAEKARFDARRLAA